MGHALAWMEAQFKFQVSPCAIHDGQSEGIPLLIFNPPCNETVEQFDFTTNTRIITHR